MLSSHPPIDGSGDASPEVILMNRDSRFSSPFRRAAARLLQFALIALTFNSTISLHAADDHANRAVKQRVAPVYPELAKRMHVSGVVCVAVTVAPDGSVSATKVVSGNHMLSGAAEDAVHKWKFVPASEESTVEISIDFKAAE
jgi:TonB family protein